MVSRFLRPDQRLQSRGPSLQSPITSAPEHPCFPTFWPQGSGEGDTNSLSHVLVSFDRQRRDFNVVRFWGSGHDSIQGHQLADHDSGRQHNEKRAKGSHAKTSETTSPTAPSTVHFSDVDSSIDIRFVENQRQLCRVSST